MKVFNLKKTKMESGQPTGEVSRLEEQIRREFERDEMMFELHLIRAFKAIEQGRVTLEEELLKV